MKNLSKLLLQNGMNVELSYIQNFKNGFENDVVLLNHYISKIEDKLQSQKIITETVKLAKVEFQTFKEEM